MSICYKNITGLSVSVPVVRHIITDGKRKRINLGYYQTPVEAYEVYKRAKENYIKQVADEYRSYIPNELYQALYKYEVNIND